MKKSIAMLKAEAGHCTEIAEALGRALDYIGPFVENGEGGWALRRLVRKARVLKDKFFARAMVIEREIQAREVTADV